MDPLFGEVAWESNPPAPFNSHADLSLSHYPPPVIAVIGNAFIVHNFGQLLIALFLLRSRP